MEKLALQIIQTIRESLLILDSDLRVQTANDAFYRTFKVSHEDVENHLLHELGNGHWNIAVLRTALEGIIESDVPVENFVVRHFFPHIGEKAMSLNARLIHREEGAAPLLLLAIEDITELERVEQIRGLHLSRLEQSNRELEDFAYIASHDLQEPLRAIQAFSERLRVKNAHLLDQQGVDYLERIEKAATRMRQLISDLLAYSRVTTKSNPMVAVNLAPVMQFVMADLAVRLRETGGKVEIGELPVITADASQIRLLLQNLIDNSLKFHRKGEPPHVKITSSNTESDFISLWIQDNGIGFEDKFTERIFSPFERLHNARHYVGTGIGLAICRKIVERHHGNITASSVLGQGSLFHIRLPLKQPE